MVVANDAIVLWSIDNGKNNWNFRTLLDEADGRYQPEIDQTLKFIINRVMRNALR